MDEAYDVYVSFYRRTKYNYLKERVNNKYFAAWATNILKYPQTVIIGAYHHNKLSAVSISYLIEEEIFYAPFFSDVGGYKMHVGDFMIHIVREAASLPDAKYIFMGMVTGHKSLDGSKLMKGYKLVKMPAYYRINPMVLVIAKTFMKNRYKKSGALELVIPEKSKSIGISAGTLRPRGERARVTLNVPKPL